MIARMKESSSNGRRDLAKDSLVKGPLRSAGARAASPLDLRWHLRSRDALPFYSVPARRRADLAARALARNAETHSANPDGGSTTVDICAWVLSGYAMCGDGRVSLHEQMMTTLTSDWNRCRRPSCRPRARPRAAARTRADARRPCRADPRPVRRALSGGETTPLTQAVRGRSGDRYGAARLGSGHRRRLCRPGRIWLRNRQSGLRHERDGRSVALLAVFGADGDGRGERVAKP